MVTARRPFDGEDITDAIAAVVSKEPDWSRVPAPLTRLLQQCLQKDPRKRLRDIGDAWSLIDDAPRAVGATAASRGPLTFALAGAAAIATIAAVALAYVHFSEQPPAGSRIMRRQATGEGSDEVLVASAEGQTPTSLSRDGQFLAFGFPRKETRSPDLFVLPLTGPADRRKPYALAATPLIEVDPKISPDGRWVAYVEQDPGSAGRIGRGEIYVRPFPASPEAQPKGTKWQVSSEGAGFPRWLAGGRQLSYVTGPEAAQRIVVVDVLQASDAARGAQAFQWVR